MNELFHVLLVFLGGMLLGVAFLGSLWITVSKGLNAKLPGLWFALSYVLRLALVVAGFYFISGGRWQYLLACFLGFMVSRALILNMARPDGLLAGEKNALHET